MCARRFLAVVFILTLIVVAGAFAIFQWGGDALLKEATPKGHFQAASAGSGPDYSNLDSWLCHPPVFGTPSEKGTPVQAIDDPCTWQPRQEVPYDLKGSAAIFYIHPTTYLEGDRWNAPLHPGGDTEFRTRLFAQSQASAFFDAGRIWAPRYRQAAFGAFLLRSADAQSALGLAYRDVAAAFDRFVAESGNAPIILAGHSQGALHLERLLREKIAGNPISKRVIAAYVVGWPISTKSDLPLLGLPACRKGEQVGCVLSWMTFREPANADLMFNQWEKTKGLNWGQRRRQDVLCVNPITGSQNGANSKGIAGTLVPTADFHSATISYDSLGAHCDKGLLIVDGNVPPLGPYVLPGNNYHVYDYALFWGAIRQDAQRRLAAWRG